MQTRREKLKLEGLVRIDFEPSAKGPSALKGVIGAKAEKMEMGELFFQIHNSIKFQERLRETINESNTFR